MLFNCIFVLKISTLSNIQPDMKYNLLKTHIRFFASALLLCAAWCAQAQEIPFCASRIQL